jgi:multidrug efflux pump subunit AcrB
MTRTIEASYRPVLSRALKAPKTTVALAALVFAASLALVPRIGFSLFPKAGIPQFLVSVEMAEGTSLSETDRAVRFVESVLGDEPHVADVVANVGRGNPRIYYNVAPKNEKSNVGEVFARVDTFETAEQERIFRRLRDRLAEGFPSATLELREFENGPPLDAPIALRVLGDDPEAIERAAGAVERILLSTEGTRYVRNPGSERKSDLRVHVDREKAALLGVPLEDLERVVRLAVGGVAAGKFRDPGQEEAMDIRVVAARTNPPTVHQGGGRPTLDVLERVYVGGSGGALPLAQVADVGFEQAPAKLWHYNRTRSATVTSQVREGFNTDRVTKDVLAKVNELSLPPGVRVMAAGEIESRSESFGGMGTAIVVALFGVLAVLVLEFRTFRATLIVASVIPLGVVGGLVALWLAGMTLSFTATIGFVALMGIEVKNSILLVDFTNQLRAEGASTEEAIQRAGEVRFVPILLTTLTALGGLVPLVLERSALYSPLAMVLVGGLISSTILARIVTPVLYKLFDPYRDSAEVESSAALPILSGDLVRPQPTSSA